MAALWRTVLAAWLAGLGVGATAASAATVSVTRDAHFHSFNEVRYVASPGEANDLTAEYAADALSVSISDPGAVITTTGSCASRSPHMAVCTAPDPPFPIAGPFVQKVRALLGDRNDRAITTRTGPNVIGGIDAFGGPGDDVLIGSPVDDTLDGGGGTDVLRGGGGDDILSDGDRDATTARLAPNADMLAGGPGADTLSYRQRTHGVVVDLASGTRVGEPRERDVASGFESVKGGSGNDRLAGDQNGNELDGGGGTDRLIGRGGDDILRSASGSEVQCGRGFDVVTRPARRTRIESDCERLSIRLPPHAVADSGATIRPTPQRTAGALRFDVSCPDTDGEPVDCGATARVRAPSGQRLLATGTITGRAARNRFLRLHLTALGRRLQDDRERQWARLVIRGPLMRRTAWSIRF
jgi:Ca2+-binding RTX toxin-like protein